MYSDIQETDCKQYLVLLQNAHVKFLTHRHDQIPINIADIADD